MYHFTSLGTQRWLPLKKTSKIVSFATATVKTEEEVSKPDR